MRHDNLRTCKAACVSAFLVCVLALASCTHSPPLIGMLYTNRQRPLTEDLHNTPVPDLPPSYGKILEIREPITGLGFYGRINSNAMGPVAKQNGISTLYFADEEIFSVLGIWAVTRLHLYGDNGQPPTH